MKKIINAIRDLIYNITDYGLIIAVIVVMVAVLAWRFDILFNRNIEKEAIASVPSSSQSEAQNNQGSDSTADNPDDKTNDKDNKGQSDVIATIEIPNGSFPAKIGEILVNSNLIDDKNEFLSRSVELGLDTKLQSGTFEIAVGTSLDDVIKIISKTN